MIKSQERDSGGFDQNAERITAPPNVHSEHDEAEAADPLVNTVFADKYFIEKRLGAGGMSVVYLARHEALNKHFAIKTLHNHLSSKTSSLMRFKQEAQAASRLQHPGIVAMHDYGVSDDGTPYLVMDYVSGESLADLLNKTSSLESEIALNIFKQTVAAIAHAHNRGIVHRDIKPSNIMLNDDEHHNLMVKIVDFGVAKFVESEESAKLTQTGEALGSPLYMSPEQCLGQPLDIRSDIYSFGCVMYETITGVPPLQADGVFKIMMKHIHDVPSSFKDVRPDLSDSEALERIVFKALAKDPTKRYQQMDDLLADLDAVNEDKSLSQKIKTKFELTGLRQTTKSINFMAATSVVIGAAILFGANYILNTIQALSTEPNLWNEGVIWQAYPDKPAITESDEEKHSLLGSGVGLVLQGEELGVNTVIDEEKRGLKTETAEEIVKRYANLAYSRITKAHSERRHHEYDVAENTYSEAIANINAYINRTNDVQHANALDKLIVAYMGKGDCEYFKTPPNYAAASDCYATAVKILRRTKNGYAWTQLQAQDQLYLFLRNADALTMQGRYAEASAARLLIPELMRSFDRGQKDGSYIALTQSKVAEEAFRQRNNLIEARKEYQKALEEWRKDGDNYIREQAIVTGRLAEIDAQEGAADHDSLFLDFDTLAERVRQEDPKSVRTQFFSDAYQAYAHYLWQHHEVLKAIEMHDRAAKYQPQA